MWSPVTNTLAARLWDSPGDPVAKTAPDPRALDVGAPYRALCAQGSSRGEAEAHSDGRSGQMLFLLAQPSGPTGIGRWVGTGQWNKQVPSLASEGQ